MKYIVIAWAIVFLYRLIANISSLLWLNHYDKAYKLFLSNPEQDFTEHTAAVTKLFKSAGLTDRMIPFVQPMGLGQILQGHTMLFCNMANRREDVVGNMLSCFASARGTFKNRILENFSLIYWINCILFLPRTVLVYLGVNAESVISKIFQLMYWIITPMLLVLRDKLHQFILTFIN